MLKPKSLLVYVAASNDSVTGAAGGAGGAAGGVVTGGEGGADGGVVAGGVVTAGGVVAGGVVVAGGAVVAGGVVVAGCDGAQAGNTSANIRTIITVNSIAFLFIIVYHLLFFNQI